MPQLIFISEMLMEPKELPLVFWDAALPFIEIIRDEMFEQLRDGLAGRLIGVDLFPFEGDLRRVVADQDVVTGEHEDPDRALLAALLSVIPKARRNGLLLVTPDAIPRWHRDIVPTLVRQILCVPRISSAALASRVASSVLLP